MDSRETDFVKAMNNACQTGFTASGDLTLYKRMVMAFFVLAGLMFSVSLLISQSDSNNLSQSAAVGNDGGSEQTRPPLFVPKSCENLTVASSEDLINKLQVYDLWENPLPAAVPPVILDRYPEGIDQLPIEEKKKAFLHTLLPIALVALSEVAEERRQLMHVLDKYKTPPEEFSSEEEDNTSWKKPLKSSERKFIANLTQKYRTTSVTGLLSRVKTVPVSLILAQGAIESSWGSSRFANQGNNLFGIWTWGTNGIIPNEREEGKNHMVAAYDSLLDSVRAYILMLNRVTAYSQLRAIRKKTSDPVALAAGLLNYSERGGVYVSDIGRIIEYNNLRDFDSLGLARSSVKTTRTDSIFTMAGISTGLGKFFSN